MCVSLINAVSYIYVYKGCDLWEKKLVGAFEKKYEMFLIRRKLYLRWSQFNKKHCTLGLLEMIHCIEALQSDRVSRII